jgi:hypothetical protein
LLLGLCAALLAGPHLGTACASPLSAGAGVDRQSGPGDHAYTAGLLFGTVSLSLADATLALIRYDDSVTGRGNALFANAGVSVPTLARVRVIGARSIGDGGYRSWKLRAGPEWSIHLLTLGIYGLHQEDNASARLNAVGAEVGTSIVPSLTAQVGGMVGRREGSANSSQGSCSIVWAAFSHVQLLGEVDVGTGVPTSTTSTSGGGPLQRLPVGGGLGAGRPGDRTIDGQSVETVGLLGVRFVIP